MKTPLNSTRNTESLLDATSTRKQETQVGARWSETYGAAAPWELTTGSSMAYVAVPDIGTTSAVQMWQIFEMPVQVDPGVVDDHAPKEQMPLFFGVPPKSGEPLSTALPENLIPHRKHRSLAAKAHDKTNDFERNYSW